MKAARLVVLVVAVAAGGGAALLAGRGGDEAPPAPVAAKTSIDTVDVLVAKDDVQLGQSISAQNMQWQLWPVAAASPVFIRKADKPNAIEDLTGAIARAPFVAGEPLRESKLIKANGSGYMAAVLDKGMRAISTEISPETGAGGFILPNDRVDVILSRRDREAEKAGAADTQVSETILANIRILAIDQTLGEKDGQKVVIGKTATLELSPRQSETLALSRQLGTLSLALRSLADAGENYFHQAMFAFAAHIGLHGRHEVLRILTGEAWHSGPLADPAVAMTARAAHRLAARSVLVSLDRIREILRILTGKARPPRIHADATLAVAVRAQTGNRFAAGRLTDNRRLRPGRVLPCIIARDVLDLGVAYARKNLAHKVVPALACDIGLHRGHEVLRVLTDQARYPRLLADAAFAVAWRATDGLHMGRGRTVAVFAVELGRLGPGYSAHQRLAEGINLARMTKLASLRTDPVRIDE